MGEISSVDAEVAKQTTSKTESKPTGPTKGKREYEFQGNRIEVNFVRFSGEENPKSDSKKAAFLLTGWPMRADAQITWGQPQMLAKDFGVNTYEIDGRPKGNFNMDSIVLEVEGIRQFASELESNGINEITLFGHSIGAAKAMDLALALQQRNPNLKTNLVLMNPAGFYPQDIWTLVRAYAGGAGVNAETKNPKRISQDFLPVLVNLTASIFKDIKQTKHNILKLWRDQKLKSTEFNVNLAKIKSPVMIMVATEDPLFPPEGIFPPEEVDKRIAFILPEDELRQQIEQSGRWENLKEEERIRFGSKEVFVEDYLSHNRKTYQKIRTREAREQYLKEEVMPNAENIRVVVAEKYGNHIAFGVERPRPSSYLIARTLRS